MGTLGPGMAYSHNPDPNLLESLPSAEGDEIGKPAKVERAQARGGLELFLKPFSAF